MKRYCLIAAVLLLTWSAVGAKPLVIKGQIKEIDAKKGTITLAADREGRQEGAKIDSLLRGVAPNGFVALP